MMTPKARVFLNAGRTREQRVFVMIFENLFKCFSSFSFKQYMRNL